MGGLPTHPTHGVKLEVPLISFPQYDARKLWGRATPQHHLKSLIAKLLRVIYGIIPNEKTEEQYIDIIYSYFRDIQHIHPELLITELDIRQLINFGMTKFSEKVESSLMDSQRKPSFKSVLEIISLEKDILKKSQLAISFIQNSTLHFHELLEILKLFHNIDTDKHLAYKMLHLDPDLHDLIRPWVQYLCEQLMLMKDEIQSFLFHNYTEGSGQDDIEDSYPYYIAKELTVFNLMYGMKDDLLNIEADYLLKLDLDNSRITYVDEFGNDVRFETRKASGSVGFTIDRNKKINIEHCDIGD